jgi:hypothetical protein
MGCCAWFAWRWVVIIAPFTLWRSIPLFLPHIDSTYSIRISACVDKHAAGMEETRLSSFAYPCHPSHTRVILSISEESHALGTEILR